MSRRRSPSPLRRFAPAVVVAVVMALVTGACGGPDGPTSTAPAGTLLTCRAPGRMPQGYRQVEVVEVPQQGRVGARVTYRSAERSLHLTAGIAGEFTEGAEPQGTVSLAGGGRAVLFGTGSDWVVVWEEGGTCDPRTAAGNGYDRRSFVDVLADAGVVQPAG